MATMATTHRSNRMSKQDMEASRLVFVYVKDAKPKRKVAVPVPDGYAWSEFIAQVRGKLRISGVKEIFMASTGHQVTSLDELQDIDELCVVEGPEPPAAVSTATVASTSDMVTPNGKAFPRQASTSEAHKIAVSGLSGAPSGGHDDQGKYRARANPLKRALQKLMPGVFSPGLPLTAGDTGEAGGGPRGTRRRRGGKRNVVLLRNVLLVLAVLSCMATMLWLTLLSSPKATLQT